MVPDRPRARATVPRSLPVLLIAILLLAPLSGCLGGGAGDTPSENTQTTPTSSTPTTTTPATPTEPTSGGQETAVFLIEDLRIVPATGDERAEIYEDDRVVARFTVRHPGDTDQAVERFVSYALDRQIVDVVQLRLEPGQSRDFEYPIGAARGRESILVEVRIAPTSARAEVEVQDWPRTRESVDAGNLTVRVNRWLRDELTGDILVNATFTVPPDAPETRWRVKILCADATGNVTMHGDARPAFAEPGQPAVQDLQLPDCRKNDSDTIYGIAVLRSSEETPGQRILFVEHGWRPPMPEE